MSGVQKERQGCSEDLEDIKPRWIEGVRGEKLRQKMKGIWNAMTR